jgi:hypothetical protein
MCSLPSHFYWFSLIKCLVGDKEATTGSKKAPSPKRCCPKTKLHIPSFPSTGGTDISIYALEAFQPTVCLPWILFRQDSSERANT